MAGAFTLTVPSNLPFYATSLQIITAKFVVDSSGTVADISLGAAQGVVTEVEVVLGKTLNSDGTVHTGTAPSSIDLSIKNQFGVARSLGTSLTTSQFLAPTPFALSPNSSLSIPTTGMTNGAEGTIIISIA